MVNEVTLKEFGFSSIEKFPRRLDNQEITLTLPEVDGVVDPIAVDIVCGLLVPIQLPSQMQQGMIITDEGCVVSIAQKIDEPEAELEIKYVEDVPYDARIEIANVMRRAVIIDETLGQVWDSIESYWEMRFPPTHEELQRQGIGFFKKVEKAWEGMAGAFSKLTQQIHQSEHQDVSQFQLQVVVQTQQDFHLGWKGVEKVIGRVRINELEEMTVVEYLEEKLGPALKEELADPIYDPQSDFRLFYEARLFPTVKLVVIGRDM